MHPRLELVERTIHQILSPLGFKKKKLSWQRDVGDVMQCVQLDKGTYGDNTYHFYYGLLVKKLMQRRDVDAEVQWCISQIITSSKRNNIYTSLEMDSDMLDPERIAVIQGLLKDYVLPTFAATDTVEKLRSVIGNFKHPYSTLLTGFRAEDL